MRHIGTLALAGAVLAFTSTADAALIVTTTTDAAALANVLVGGSGEIVITSQSLVGTSTQQGTFTGGTSAGLGIESGVILTTGSALNAPGPNTSDNLSSSLNTPGDPDLSLLSGQTTYDANALNIKFTTTTGSLFFQYVFASEEYSEFVNSQYNDVFGFFINGTNVALVPGTTLPVTINNVNCGNPNGNPTQTNCSQFVDNAYGTGSFDLQYDGFTKVFTAAITGLTAGVEYDLLMKIADAGDSSLDSAVFLKAGSFQGTDPDPDPVPEPATLMLVGLGLVGMAARRRRA